MLGAPCLFPVNLGENSVVMIGHSRLRLTKSDYGGYRLSRLRITVNRDWN